MKYNNNNFKSTVLAGKLTASRIAIGLPNLSTPKMKYKCKYNK